MDAILHFDRPLPGKVVKRLDLPAVHAVNQHAAAFYWCQSASIQTRSSTLQMISPRHSVQFLLIRFGSIVGIVLGKLLKAHATEGVHST